MSWSNPLPTPTTIGGNTNESSALSAINAKYLDATNWATWAATLMEEQLAAISNSVGADGIAASITPLLNLINTAPAYSAGSLSFTNTPFSDSLLTDLKSRLSSDLNTLGLTSTIEQALYDRALSRTTDERALAYTELTTQFSARGFDVPPGALLAKQTEVNNEASKRMADTNKDILHEHSLYQLEILKVTEQLIQIMGALNDSQMMRNFEIQKVAVMQALDAYKAQLSLFEVKGGVIAQSSKLSAEATLRTMTVEIEAFKGVAQSAAQMVASSLNSVNASAAYGWSGGKSTSLQYQLSGEMGVDTPPTI